MPCGSLSCKLVNLDYVLRIRGIVMYSKLKVEIWGVIESGIRAMPSSL